MRLEILVFPGFDELDALAPLEVLRNAARHRDEFDIALVSLDGESVTGSHGVRVGVDQALSDSSDLLVVPGGGWNDRSQQGVRAEIAAGRIPAALSAAHQRGATVAGVCTGGMLLAAAGLTGGRPATTHRSALEALGGSGAMLIHARVVDDGDIITAAGVTASLDLAFWLVQRYAGPGLASEVARAMEYEQRGRVWVRGRDPVPADHA